uniref:Anti-proliferative protein domain-containing protein n=2 Tax=Parascaris univalens TaxID=6257 RepID=A0A915C5E2_PARUN
MYTELKEVVNFLAKFMRARIARRRMCVFLEHVANGLLVRHENTWDVGNPKFGERDRSIYINAVDGCSELITLVASTLSIDIHLLLSSFPDNLAVFWNPGEVFYRAGDARIILPIWSGETNSDENYSPLPAGVFYRPSAYEAALIATGKAIAGQNTSPTTDALASLHEYVHFELVPWDQHSDFYWSTDVFSPSHVPALVFRFVSQHDHPFTVSSFANTRFGSLRSQPDHEALKRIQHAAEHKAAPVVAGANNPPAERQIVQNGHCTCSPDGTLLTFVRQPLHCPPLSAYLGVSNMLPVNGSGGTFPAGQSRVGMIPGSAQQPVAHSVQFYPMGDGAFSAAQYLTSTIGNGQEGHAVFGGVASRGLQLGGGDGHQKEAAFGETASNQFCGDSVAYIQRSPIMHNAGVTRAASAMGEPNGLLQNNVAKTGYRATHTNVLNVAHPKDEDGTMRCNIESNGGGRNEIKSGKE